jgi:hypothetical protein
MANLTYRELLCHLNSLREDRLDDNVTIYLTEQDEWMPVTCVEITTDSDVLDYGHTYLEVQY